LIFGIARDSLLLRAAKGWVVVRPKERHRTGQADIFRARLDQIIDMKHPLVLLAGKIDWSFLEVQFGAVYTDRPGRPPLPTRLMAGLAILKSMHDLSDEALCDRWVANPYFQLFCGEEFFQHRLVFDRSSITRWRQRMGEEKLAALVQESLAVATRTGAAKPSDFSRVIVDTTVQPKNVRLAAAAPPRTDDQAAAAVPGKSALSRRPQCWPALDGVGHQDFAAEIEHGGGHLEAVGLKPALQPDIVVQVVELDGQHAAVA